MPQKNRWHIVIVVLHWLMALLVFSLYGLGWYMVDLDYYDSWYRVAPYWHKTFGVVVGGLLLLRIIARWATVRPKPESSGVQQWLSSIAHVALYAGLIVAVITGYLMATADGEAIDVGGLFMLSALNTELLGDLSAYEDDIWFWHERSTNLLVLLAVGHALAGLKHHFWDRDRTLLRMLGLSRDNKKHNQ